MTENRLKWTLMRGSTGVDTLHTNFFTWDLSPNHKILGDVIPSRGGDCNFIVKMDNECISSGSRNDVFTAISDVEYLIEELVQKLLPPVPVSPTPHALDGVPAPKEERMDRVIYDPNRPIVDQLERNWKSSQRPHSFANKRVVCGNYLLSIQASANHYCSPRQNNYDLKDYNSFELVIMDEKSDFVGDRLVPDMFHYDDVAGHVEPRILDLLAQKISKLPVGYIHPDYKPREGFYDGVEETKE